MITLEIQPEARPGLALLRLAFRPPRVPEDEGRYLAALDQIGAQDAPFLLMLDLAGAGEAPAEVGRAQARWLKRHRADLRAQLRAVSVVMANPTPRAERSFARLFAVPVLVTDQSAVARAFLLAAAAEPEVRT